MYQNIYVNGILSNYDSRNILAKKSIFKCLKIYQRYDITKKRIILIILEKIILIILIKIIEDFKKIKPNNTRLFHKNQFFKLEKKIFYETDRSSFILVGFHNKLTLRHINN